MICVVALIVFGILGIFSARHRVVAKEAANCVFRRVTLRKCDTGLDKRLKNQITAKFGKKSPRLARFLFKYFEVFSWIMIILLIWSIWGMGVGVYNYAYYGSCIAPGDSGVCVFNLQESINQYSSIRAEYPEEMIFPNVSSPSIGQGERLIMFGCFTCPYTIQAEMQIREMVEEYKDKIEFVFVDFPLLNHRGSMELSKQARCAYEQGQYYEARLKIYDKRLALTGNNNLAKELNLDIEQFDQCVISEHTEQVMLQNIQLGIDAHVRGTPTFFFREQKFDGVRAVQDILNLIENN